MHSAVGSSPASVGIAEFRWRNHSVVEGRIEYLPLILGPPFYPYLSKRRDPIVFSGIGHGVEIPSRKFLIHIPGSTFH